MADANSLRGPQGKRCPTAPHAAAEAIGLALCPAPDHKSYCPVPWTTIVVRFEDLEPEDRASWQEIFDEQRIAAREAGEPGA